MNLRIKNEYAFINDLKELEQLAYRTSIKIQTQINNEMRDARVSTFYFMAQAIRSLKIYLILKKEYLDHGEWYMETYLSKYKQQWPVIGGKVSQIINDHSVLTKEFNEVMLMGYTQILFSIVESKFRLFQMTIDPNALRGKRDAFYHVYTWLLTRVNKTRYKRRLRFFALIRNTIHNNGMYMNADYKHVRIQYKKKKYEFKHNKFVNYGGGAFNLLLLQITPDVIDMMEDIILNSELIKINSIAEPVESLVPRLVINQSHATT